MSIESPTTIAPGAVSSPIGIATALYYLSSVAFERVQMDRAVELGRRAVATSRGNLHAQACRRFVNNIGVGKFSHADAGQTLYASGSRDGGGNPNWNFDQHWSEWTGSTAC